MSDTVLVPSDIGTLKRILRELIVGPHFGAILEEVAERFPDRLALDALGNAQVTESELATQTLPTLLPFCELVGERASFTDNVAIEMAEYTISTVWWTTGDTEEIVTKRGERYVLTTRKLIRRRFRLATGSLDPYGLIEEYGIVGRKPDTTVLLKASSLTFRVQMYDEP